MTVAAGTVTQMVAFGSHKWVRNINQAKYIWLMAFINTVAHYLFEELEKCV